MAYISPEYLCNYLHTHIMVCVDGGRNYYTGVFDGFDHQNNIYMNECKEIEVSKSSNNLEVKKTLLYLGTHLIDIASIQFVYSRNLPPSDDMSRIMCEDFKKRNFCTNGNCESLITQVSPLGGYIGPSRGAERHLQAQPFCNCSNPFLLFGPQTTAPLPMATRTYLPDHFDMRYFKE